jgi:hypothetical protein
MELEVLELDGHIIMEIQILLVGMIMVGQQEMEHLLVLGDHVV